MMIPDIRIEDYNYDLPDDRIAKYPLPDRDASRLLKYSDSGIETHSFSEIVDFVPEGSIMVFNDTKVVPARLHFQRETGLGVTLHGLRHGFASILYKNNVDIKTAAYVLGHAQSSTTLEIYTHLMEQDKLSSVRSALNQI